MPRLTLPNSVSLHTARNFLEINSPFEESQDPGEGVLEFNPRWAHLEPIGLVMTSAWGAWCRRNGWPVRVENLDRHARYAARMRLFEHLGVEFEPGITEHEEAGRFMPVKEISDQGGIREVIGDISALLHLEDDPESLAAVQYSISELLRNVLEHSGSPEGAFVCAHRYRKKAPERVTIAVADCGHGISQHLATAHPEAADDDEVALGLAMRPGVTGAVSGVYGTPDNAGAGLYITRCIAKGTGGYFFLTSGSAAYRLRRTKTDIEQSRLYWDPYDEPRHDRWSFADEWKGTAASVEIRTDRIADYSGFFQWIFKQIPKRESKTRRIQFT